MYNQDAITIRQLAPALLLAVLLSLLLAAIARADTDRSHGLLWEISKPGVPPSWLYGTIHSEDPDILDLAAKYSAQEYFMEEYMVNASGQRAKDIWEMDVEASQKKIDVMFSGAATSDFRARQKRDAEEEIDNVLSLRRAVPNNE